MFGKTLQFWFVLCAIILMTTSMSSLILQICESQWYFSSHWWWQWIWGFYHNHLWCHNTLSNNLQGDCGYLQTLHRGRSWPFKCAGRSGSCSKRIEYLEACCEVNRIMKYLDLMKPNQNINLWYLIVVCIHCKNTLHSLLVKAKLGRPFHPKHSHILLTGCHILSFLLVWEVGARASHHRLTDGLV